MTLDISAWVSATAAEESARAAHDALIPYWVAAIASTLTLILNGVGLLIIWKQLKANEKAMSAATDSAVAATDAANIARTSSRPWIKLTAEQAYFYFNPGNQGQVGCQLNVKYENIGHTPAIQVYFVHKPVPIGAHIEVDWHAEYATLSSDQRPVLSQTLFPGDSVSIGPSRNFDFPPQVDERFMTFRIVAAVFYKAHAHGQVHATYMNIQPQQTKPETPEHRMYRGMGNIECLTMNIGQENPDPT